ncbi:MAG: DUF1289 domain-containing protein [Casimicrobiaceae bacterium]
MNDEGAAPNPNPNPEAPVTSPCIGVCRIDPQTGWCVGCVRSLDEIAAWGSLDDRMRREVLARIALRRVTPR